MPWVPAIDGDLKSWFGKDTLWQAQDERYTADQVRIIPGPVAVAGITAKNEPVADLLARFEQATTDALLEQGSTPQTSEELLRRVEDALAEEIGLLLDEHVVAAPEDVDLCMILGANWPLHLGGITPYLDDCGAAERVNGRRFHPAAQA